MGKELDRLKLRISKFTSIMGISLFFLPLILILIDGNVRSSISDYAYMANNEWFFSLISIAGTVFIVDGSLWNTRWYNIILGICLVGVALTPFRDSLLLAVLHYIFAGIFFLGSFLVIAFMSSKYQKYIPFALYGFILVALLISFIIPECGIFWAEWLGMVPITLYFLGKLLGIFK